MTSHQVSGPFVCAPNGWRIAIGDPESSDITVVPVIGWQPRAENKAESSIEGSALEPVVLFDNVKEPIITTVTDTIAGWPKGTYVHQVLAPGVSVREVPEGWSVVDPYQG
ncbi:hypothetical protein ABZ759_30490 [Streptomyces sp. NPDC047860]|uniref:hypothetical protein n=1 Tax=Streptomyces sp. NPDC047860 TaxID=3155743 RepID=UPI00340F6411